MKNLIQKYLVFCLLIIFIDRTKAEREEAEKMNIHKEFDFPPIFYTNIDKLKSHPALMDSPLKPLMHLKKAMGTLPARLPPIYYPHHFFSHGPYEGDAKIMFQNHVQAMGMLMPIQHPNLMLPNLTLTDETRLNDLQASHTFGLISKLQQQMTAQQALKQLGPQATGMRPQQGVAGAAQGAAGGAQGAAGAAQSAAGAAQGSVGAMQLQRPAGAAGAMQRPAGASGAMQRPAGAAGAMQRPGGAAGATQKPAGAKPTPGKGTGVTLKIHRKTTTPKPKPPGPPPTKPPDFDYTEENLWLTGGLYLTALILKGLGSDIQFQAPLIGRKKREEDLWESERFSLGKWLSSFTTRTKSRKVDAQTEVDQCLEFVACKQPFWAHFYLINLKQMKASELLQKILQRLEKGISVEKNKCGTNFVCNSKDLPPHFLK